MASKSNKGKPTLDRKKLFGDVASDDRAALSKAQLDAGLALAIATLEAQSGKRARVALQDNWLVVVQPDRPFIVDSLLGAVNALGMVPTLVAHPQLAGSEGTLSIIALAFDDLSNAEQKSLLSEVKATLADIATVVGGWKSMHKRVEQATERLQAATDKVVPTDQRDEALAFMHWLLDHNFIFMGVRRYDWQGTAKNGGLVPSTEEKGLGLLADPDLRVLREGTTLVTMSPDIRAFLQGEDPLIITKAGVRARVHRLSHYDYIGIKLFGDDGSLDGELRIIGLFTSAAYSQSVQRIPRLRRKMERALDLADLDPNSHSGKALINVIETYPRDELFQADADELAETASAIVRLDERPRARIFTRTDKFGRFVSCLVYVPRERYDSEVRVAIGEYLAETFKGRVSMFQPSFPEGRLARVHFIIGRDSDSDLKIDHEALGAAVTKITRNWDDAFVEQAGDLSDPGFDAAYKDTHDVEEALTDATSIADLSGDRPLIARFFEAGREGDNQVIRLDLYHAGPPLILSRRVPILENFGFDVLDETSFKVGGGDVHLHEMRLCPRGGVTFKPDRDAERLQSAFMAVWDGNVTDDGFNQLVVTAGLTISQVNMLRAYARYFQQISVGFTQDYLWRALQSHPSIARRLWDLFESRFDPQTADDARSDRSAQIGKAIETALESVDSADEDAIIRRFLQTIKATLRTSYYQHHEDGQSRELTFKLDPAAMDGLPEPLPYRELWVFGSQVEGVHLRFGPVARGGLRWSDRAQDFRTEVLGLVKAQQVKNAVIVPVGSKGGFYPKQLPNPSGDRNAWFEAGKDAYKTFIRSLLSVTDNIVDGDTLHPDNTVVHDGPDPYFVVAADKGTSTFSDTANGIAQDEGFWLDDAFASGGSAGYDHKAMGITARGGWEAVKRHFREMDRNIQTEPFTAVGVGDMSGDVFGNGMLLSEQTKLLAAFDHRDIFLDPDPDVTKSFKERKRLFEAGRSSWQDYNQKTMSEGGMIVSRREKSVSLTKQVQDMLGLSSKTATPNEIMRSILMAPSDLLWFGGIGTYVKAETESHADAGDRANDAIRVDAGEVGAKVIGEGANLGVTQPARIAFDLAGGSVNSDAIDNSAGVNSSDVEVNIKIALAGPMKAGDLPLKRRNALLEKMTDEVADLVLTNNYRQTLAITLEEAKGLSAFPAQQRFMQSLENTGDLNRDVEDLPDDRAMARRLERGQPLTRPEIGVLLAYAKIVLFRDLVESDLPDSDYLCTELLAYFPTPMRRKYEAAIEGHRLRREIIATAVANVVVNRTGPTFVFDAATRTGASPVQTARAILLSRAGNDLPKAYAAIDALDNQVPWELQQEMYLEAGAMVRRQAIDMLMHDGMGGEMETEVASFQADRKSLLGYMPKVLPSYIAERHADRLERYNQAEAVDSKLAATVAQFGLAAYMPDIRAIAQACSAELKCACKVYFRVTEAFRIGMIVDAADKLSPTDFYDGLALDRALFTLRRARRKIAQSVIERFGDEDEPVACWMAAERGQIARVSSAVSGIVDDGALSEISVARLSVVATFLDDLAGSD
ncbi:MAG: NAD-glutamate dehydrogenase [Pseudomonadota bacterium]